MKLKTILCTHLTLIFSLSLLAAEQDPNMNETFDNMNETFDSEGNPDAMDYEADNLAKADQLSNTSLSNGSVETTASKLMPVAHRPTKNSVPVGQAQSKPAPNFSTIVDQMLHNPADMGDVVSQDDMDESPDATGYNPNAMDYGADTLVEADQTPSSSSLSNGSVETTTSELTLVAQQPTKTSVQAQQLSEEIFYALTNNFAFTPPKNPATYTLKTNDISPLALHAVAFIERTTLKYDLKAAQDAVKQELSNPGIAWRLQRLQFLSLALDILRILEGQMSGPTTTGSQTALVSSAPNVASTFQPPAYLKRLQDAMKKLLPTTFEQTSSDEKYKYNKLMTIIRKISQGSLNNDEIDTFIPYLEKILMDLLKSIDTYFPTPANSVRCLTWIVSPKPNDEEFVHTPFGTMVPKNDTHIMFYNHMGPYGAGQIMTLKVLVGNFLCEVPFEVKIPETLLNMSVVVVAIPETRTDAQGVTEVIGVNVYLYGYNDHNIANMPPTS